jgi:hypothetical protein
MFDDRFGYGFGWFWHIGSFIGGLILVAAVVVVAVLLVRYLIVATRAAQFYLDSHDTVRPAAPPAAKPATTTTPAQPAATKPTRTPKTPPPAV